MSKIQAEIYRIADLLGVKLSTRNPKKDYMWDGETIGIGKLSYSNQLHELAHWQVASEELRLEKDFGLGPGPDSGKNAKRVMTMAESQIQEEEASLLGIAYEAYLGMSYEDTLDRHEWVSLCNDGLFWITINRLTKKGLLKDHQPAVK